VSATEEAGVFGVHARLPVDVDPDRNDVRKLAGA